ncbi:FAD dependent oxidoreductase [Coniochaeta ligniaria NRRL 30616]|uniref:FAD dependent oxidoreductase n=1 Tax=Coniochaeta ligniaria NRRL 30616 TaxID=1408157 RepID=A0A1J7JSW2_9PEZI|nr:FAD dependent oxidoreductase [Coniochaeta ligniaria NRRL 30616]
MTTNPPPSYLILGSGVFGASTALHLILTHPDAAVTLVDRDAHDAPTRVAASWDWNKVVRADYSDILYTKLALEAQDLWRTDAIWKPFYHESGVVWISGTSFAKKVIANHAALGVEAKVNCYSVEETRKLYEVLFEGADYTGVEEVLVNQGSGWAEAKEALQSTIEAAIALGVKYVTAEVTAIQLEESGGQRRCRGVVSADGRRISADRVVLCTGAYTPKLLMDSAPECTDLHAGERILASAVTEATAPVSLEERPSLDTMPVGINENPVERGDDVGCLPLPGLGAVKCWGQVHFRNTVTHPVTKQLLSTSPMQRDYAQWEVSPALQDDVHWALRSLFGEKKADGLKMENYRICWDAWTPTEDFIISPHSACDGLFVATCGSFHGFKFLPVIGKYVVAMLAGDLDPVLQERWAWDRERPPMDAEDRCAQRELRDLAV